MKKILILDHEREVLEILEFGFKLMGHDVTSYADLDTAMSCEDFNFYDYIFLETDFPQMTGLEFGHFLRNKKIQTPLIFYSRFGSLKNLYQDKVHQIEGSFYLTKPSSLDLFQSIFEQIPFKSCNQ